VHLLESAGFESVRLVKLDAKPCFQREGVAMREQQLEGFKPAVRGGNVTVIYKGPFRQVTADDGTVLVRGERITLGSGEAARLKTGAAAEQFLILD
jgi:hypothetical protein